MFTLKDGKVTFGYDRKIGTYTIAPNPQLNPNKVIYLPDTVDSLYGCGCVNNIMQTSAYLGHSWYSTHDSHNHADYLGIGCPKCSVCIDVTIYETIICECGVRLYHDNVNIYMWD